MFSEILIIYAGAGEGQKRISSVSSSDDNRSSGPQDFMSAEFEIGPFSKY